MSNVKIDRTDLKMMLDDCSGMAFFLKEAVALILIESSNYCEKDTLARGATCCIEALEDKINEILHKI